MDKEIKFKTSKQVWALVEIEKGGELIAEYNTGFTHTEQDTHLA